MESGSLEDARSCVMSARGHGCPFHCFLLCSSTVLVHLTLRRSRPGRYG